jgi:quinol monooxygenase YgiN
VGRFGCALWGRKATLNRNNCRFVEILFLHGRSSSQSVAAVVARHFKVCVRSSISHDCVAPAFRRALWNQKQDAHLKAGATQTKTGLSPLKWRAANTTSVEGLNRPNTGLCCLPRRSLLWAFLLTGILNFSCSSAAQDAGSTERIYLVAHVDLVPNAAAAGTKLLQQYVAGTRQDKGAVRVELYVERSRPNHLTLVEVWEDQKAFDAHVAAAHTKKFREQIQPMLGSPFDERLHRLVE